MSREESAARAPLAPGDLLDGKYQIIRVLGEGGMGIVYEAFHQKLEQTVAIKMMLPSMLERPSLVARFDREARAAAKIKSRHVARVFDVDVAPNGLPYIVMELLSGQDLAARLAENGPLPVSEAVGHLLEACVAIREAHARGIVHRDLKPANLFLARDGESSSIKVLDFGISKELLTSGENLTQEHAVIGTVLYMSPEQVRAGKVDTRSDIWSLGAVLYELLAGTTPFTGNVTQAAISIANDEPTPLDALRGDVPPRLADVVKRALRKLPSERFPDVESFMQALTPFASEATRAALEMGPAAAPSDPFISDAAAARVDANATTLNASDRIRAPEVPHTADGMSTETRRLSHKNQLALGAGAAVVVVAAAALTFTLAPHATGSGTSIDDDARSAAPAIATATTIVATSASPATDAATPAATDAGPSTASAPSALPTTSSAPRKTDAPRPVRSATPKESGTPPAAKPPEPKGRPDHL